MKVSLTRFLNPLNWLKAYRFHQQNAQYDKSSYDLELFLYAKLLSNDMLHYGYFDDVDIAPESISIKQIEDAQVRYAEKIIEQIADKEGFVLDVGCGMGGLSGMMLAQGYHVEALTPNVNQKNYIAQKYPSLTCHHTKFEGLQTQQQFGTVINSESLQYINLDIAFQHVNNLLPVGGRWIITDYFRAEGDFVSKSGHRMTDFQAKIAEYGWKIVYEQDITLNALPTIKFVNLYAERFLMPIKHFAFEKLRFKKAWLYYLVEPLQASINAKIEKEVAAIHPEKFLREKKYMLFTLEKTA